jgi:hypothetical protein
MTRRHSDFLAYNVSDNEGQLYSPGQAAAKLLGDAAAQLPPEILEEAASAVLYYFKKELQRDAISVGEFAGALEEVLQKLGVNWKWSAPLPATTDLRLLATEAGKGCELFFFPQLQRDLRKQIDAGRGLVRFVGLRNCVKLMLGARRWTPACQQLNDQIVGFLRANFASAAPPAGCKMLIE